MPRRSVLLSVSSGQFYDDDGTELDSSVQSVSDHRPREESLRGAKFFLHMLSVRGFLWKNYSTVPFMIEWIRV